LVIFQLGIWAELEDPEDSISKTFSNSKVKKFRLAAIGLCLGIVCLTILRAQVFICQTRQGRNRPEKKEEKRKQESWEVLQDSGV